MCIVILEALEIMLRQVFCIQNAIIGALDGTDQLIQLELHRLTIAILCVLDEEDHQEGNDGCPSVNDQLPGIGKMEHRPQDSPSDHDQHGYAKGKRMT